VPLPLKLELWTDLILNAPPDQRGLVRAIVQNRTAALLDDGLSALDDERLRWVATSGATKGRTELLILDFTLCGFGL
jgi:hypothetical protein